MQPLDHDPRADVARNASPPAGAASPASQPPPPWQVAETGGPAGPEPTRFGDWERRGRCIDF